MISSFLKCCIIFNCLDVSQFMTYLFLILVPVAMTNFNVNVLRKKKLMDYFMWFIKYHEVTTKLKSSPCRWYEIYFTFREKSYEKYHILLWIMLINLSLFSLHCNLNKKCSERYSDFVSNLATLLYFLLLSSDLNIRWWKVLIMLLLTQER